MPTSIDLTGTFYAINAGSPDGIPSVEMNQATGKLQVLIFTSKESARRYCYLKRQGLEAYIIELDKTTFRGKVLQSGLVRMAKLIVKKYPQITQFILDPPPRHGCALFIGVKDLLNDTRPIEQKPNELINFLSEQR